MPAYVVKVNGQFYDQCHGATRHAAGAATLAQDALSVQPAGQEATVTVHDDTGRLVDSVTNRRIIVPSSFGRTDDITSMMLKLSLSELHALSNDFESRHAAAATAAYIGVTSLLDVTSDAWASITARASAAKASLAAPERRRVLNPGKVGSICQLLAFDPEGERVLAVSPHDSGARWRLPGGPVAAGETDLEALARELFVEVGAELDASSVVPVHAGPAPGDGGGWVTTYLWCGSPEALMGLEEAPELDMGWMPQDTLKSAERSMMPTVLTEAIAAAQRYFECASIADVKPSTIGRGLSLN